MSKRKPKIEVPSNDSIFRLSIVEIRAEEMRIKREVAPIIREKETGAPIVFDFIFDASGSMSGLYGELADCFNKIMIPALRAAYYRDANALRIGCLLFSDKLVPAWRGFKTLDELGETPLNIEMFQQPGLGGSTALFRAMESGVVWTAAAMKQFPSGAWGKVIVLTDGANNLDPTDPREVGGILRQNRDNKKTFQTSIAYFKTGQGLSREQFDEMAQATKFSGIGFHEIASGETMEEHRRTFRHYFRFFDGPPLFMMTPEKADQA